MIQEKADTLVAKLNMEFELRPLFDTDDEAYAKFEGAIEHVLHGYAGMNPRAQKMRYWNEPVEFQGRTVVKTSSNYSHNFSEASELFRRHYGIGTEPTTMRQIAKEEGISTQKVSLYINYVLDVLRSGGNKREIYLRTL